MPAQESTFVVDETLERAYRLALCVHGIASNKVSVTNDPEATDVSLWVMAAELLCVLDEARAMRVKRAAGGDVLRPSPD
jgi:hypothetical protein